MTNPFEAILDCMLDLEKDGNSRRALNYSELFNLLKKHTTINEKRIRKILAVCEVDLKHNTKQVINALNMLAIILKKVEEGKVQMGPYITKSAYQVVQTLKKSSVHSFCLDTLMMYPDETYITLVKANLDELMTVFDFTNLEQKWEHIQKAVALLMKILKILPPELKATFIREGLDHWFLSLLPAVMWPRIPNHDIKENIIAIEMMIDTIVVIDYSNNTQWLQVLKDICDETKYQAFLKELVKNDNECWHRLWIILIKLLKSDITKIQPNSKISPINVLLPVVELGFRLDAKNRCRSFECWNALIDNFSQELNNSDVNVLNKRLKLLLTPLKLNNAKVEETVLAKLNTWWHLIIRFQGDSDKLSDMVLFPFLHFCFGKPKGPGAAQSVSAPGQITDEVSKKCTEAFVEIIGHTNCTGCATLPQLDNKLISCKSLVEHFNEWIHALGVAIRTLAGFKSEHNCLKRIVCLWKGFVLTLSDMTENQIRTDLFNEVLSFVKLLLDHNKLSVVVFHMLTCLFHDYENTTIKHLLKTKTQNGPLYVILSLLQDPILTNPYNRRTVDELIAMLRPLTQFILDTTMVQTNDVLNWMFDDSMKLKNKVYIWAALTDSICQCQKYVNVDILSKVLLWPLKNMDLFSANDSKGTWYKWHSLYNFARPLTTSDDIDKELKQIVLSKSIIDSDIALLTLSAAMALLKQKLVSDSTDYEEETEILYKVMLNIHNNEYVESITPIMIDVLTLLLSKVTENENLEIARQCVEMVNIISNVNTDHNNRVFKEKLLAMVDPLISKEAYASLRPYLSTKLCNTPVSSVIKKERSNNFATPDSKAKKSRKEANIVSTVVEDGEEFVVVKSHWKFNPRNLTEHQKEKLKRKREDIPALYQDLSQSQDSFQLSAWKPDTQDTSSTNSASKSTSRSNDDAGTILKNIPSTDVVPTIMENILSDTGKTSVDVVPTTMENIITDTTKTSENAVEKPVEAKQAKTLTPAEPKIKSKTPRIALKDRVFRNVRNLIGKSGRQGEEQVATTTSEDLNQTVNENNLKTPVSNKTLVNIVNSAPPKLNDRPSRAIKKPKKFENSELFALKKKTRGQDIRNSLEESNAPHTDLQQVKCKITLPVAIEKDLVQNDKKQIDLPPQPVPIIPEQPENIPTVEIENTETPSRNNENEGTTVNKPVEQMEVVSDNTTHKEQEPKKNYNSQVIEEILTPAPMEKLATSSQVIEEISTPKVDKTDIKSKTPSTAAKKKESDDPLIIKKKRSRIEKQLLIDMVEGHPLLQKQPDKRVSRKNSPSVASKRRKSLIEKSNKIMEEIQTTGLEVNKSKNMAIVEVTPNKVSSLITTTTDFEENLIDSQDVPSSEDVIESSQDSTLTTISVKSSGKKKMPVVLVTKISDMSKTSSGNTQNLIEEFENDIIPLSDTSVCSVSKEDIELPKNMTVVEVAEEGNSEKDLTEDMDTQPIESSSDVILVNDEQTPIEINTEEVSVGKETQEMADADTLPMDVDNAIPSMADNSTNVLPITETSIDKSNIVANVSNETSLEDKIETDNDVTHASTQSNVTASVANTSDALTDIIIESSNSGSPLKDGDQRKKDFLNNTIEISPIKTLSPIKEKTPSPEVSNEYVVIKFTSPVQSNGEPYSEKLDSPEIFTEEKTSPDKRDQSPPRKPVAPSNSSPSSSLSLKKNRPQMWSNGRAAQMLGLCVPESLQTLKTTEKANEDTKKGSPSSIPARRNLRIFYSSVGKDNQTSETDSDESQNFLKFKRNLPNADSSPSGPILKRKLAEISDEATVSPASKRKRVSFQDPPVSTTVSVQKYIEPSGIRSPQSSQLKRQERQARPITVRKSPKRLDSVFRLETVLTRAIESFTEEPTISCETQMSLDETPAVEIVKTSELNDTEPICPELKECEDPIDVIAEELSSVSTKELFVKEMQSKVETVGDLARMTELEVNRLCIKAPKVKVTRKALNDYAVKINGKIEEVGTSTVPAVEIPVVPEFDVARVDMEVQTNDVTTNDSEMQTDEVPIETVPTLDSSVQTIESGTKSTKDIVATCLAEREDFMDQLVDQLTVPFVQKLSNKLPFDECLLILSQKITPSNSAKALNSIIGECLSSESSGANLKLIQDFLYQRFESKDLILLCSQLLQKIHDKPT